MKACFIVEVVKNILMVMTLETKMSLFFLAQPVMALIAVMLKFFMSFRHGAGHKQ